MSLPGGHLREADDTEADASAALASEKGKP